MFYQEERPARQGLVVVYKTKLLRELIQKFIETIDWGENGTPNIIVWDEKIWRDNSKRGDILDKVLMIGDLKDTRSLTKVIDRHFEKYGILFGWSGKKAMLLADKKALKSSQALHEFFKDYRLICPKGYFEPQSTLGVSGTDNPLQDESSEQSAVIQNEPLNAEQDTALEQADLPAEEKAFTHFKKKLAAAVEDVGSAIEDKYDLFKDKQKVNDYQYYFGVVKICSDPCLLKAFVEK